MTTPRPASYPATATQANFTSGTKVGQPTKMEPGLAAQEQGFIPGAEILAQLVNWKFNNIAHWLLSHSDEIDALQASVSISVTVTGSNNNYNPTGFLDAHRIHFAGGSGTPTITGLAAPSAGQPFVKFFTSGATGSVRFIHESASSSAANRLTVSRQVPGQSTEVSVRAGDSGVLIYSTAAARWYVWVVTPQNTLTYALKAVASTGQTVHDVQWSDDELNSDTVALSVSGGGAATVTGFGSPTATRYKSGIKLITFSNTITLSNEDEGSTAPFRMRITGGASWTAAVGDTALFQYDRASSRWIVHPLRAPGAGGGSAELEISASPGANVNDYSPTSWQDCTSIVLTGTSTITGFAAPTSGKPMVKRVSVASGTVTIAHQSTSSVAANRVRVPNTGGAGIDYDVRLSLGVVATLRYSTIASRWEIELGATATRFDYSPIPLTGVHNNLGMFHGQTSQLHLYAALGSDYEVRGISSPTVNHQPFPRLVSMDTSVKFVHESAEATASDRIRLTTGADWDAVAGQYALLSYDRRAQRWVIHPMTH